MAATLPPLNHEREASHGLDPSAKAFQPQWGMFSPPTSFDPVSQTVEAPMFMAHAPAPMYYSAAPPYPPAPAAFFDPALDSPFSNGMLEGPAPDLSLPSMNPLANSFNPSMASQSVAPGSFTDESSSAEVLPLLQNETTALAPQQAPQKRGAGKSYASMAAKPVLPSAREAVKAHSPPKEIRKKKVDKQAKRAVMNALVGHQPRAARSEARRASLDGEGWQVAGKKGAHPLADLGDARTEVDDLPPPSADVVPKYDDAYPRSISPHQLDEVDATNPTVESESQPILNGIVEDEPLAEPHWNGTAAAQGSGSLSPLDNNTSNTSGRASPDVHTWADQVDMFLAGVDEGVQHAVETVSKVVKGGENESPPTELSNERPSSQSDPGVEPEAALALPTPDERFPSEGPASAPVEERPAIPASPAPSAPTSVMSFSDEASQQTTPRPLDLDSAFVFDSAMREDQSPQEGGSSPPSPFSYRHSNLNQSTSSARSLPRSTYAGSLTHLSVNEDEDDLKDDRGDDDRRRRDDRERSRDAEESPSLTVSLFSQNGQSLRQRVLTLLGVVGINIFLPFVNGVMLGFGEIFAREYCALWFNIGPVAREENERPVSGNTAGVGLRGTRRTGDMPGHPGAKTAAEAAGDALKAAVGR